MKESLLTDAFVLGCGGGDVLEDKGSLVEQLPCVQHVGIGGLVAVVLLPQVGV
jgi:hypothetical protein